MECELGTLSLSYLSEGGSNTTEKRPPDERGKEPCLPGRDDGRNKAVPGEGNAGALPKRSDDFQD